MKRVLIAVLHANTPPWSSLASEGIRSSWWGDACEGVQVLFYQGGSDSLRLVGDVLEVDVPEGPHTMGRKNLKAFKYILDNFEFDYLFRVNASSFVDKRALQSFLIDKPSKDYYAGVINGTYVSGAGILMSRDVLELIDKNGYALMHGAPPEEPLWVPEPEDVYLGWLVASLRIPFSVGERYNVFKDDRGAPSYPTDELGIHYHYRCKNSEDRSKDAEAMKELHNRLQQFYKTKG